jgi:transcriptional regulator with XRE-family HTH domain
MGKERVIGTVGANLKRLCDFEGLSVNGFSAKYGLVQSTVNRIVNGSISPTEVMIAAIVDALNDKGWHLAGWQLMVPDFAPAHPPMLLEASATERLKESLTEMQRQIGAIPVGGDRWIGNGVPKRRVTKK